MNVVAEWLAVACPDGATLARIGGRLGELARARRRELDVLPAPRRREVRAVALATAISPIPPGLRGVDPTWIEAALASTPPRARGAVAGAVHDPVDVWLARWVTATIPPMPTVDAALVRPPGRDDITRMSRTHLEAWLAEVGIDQIAFAAGAEGALLERSLGARVGAAIARISRAPRSGELGSRRAAITRCQPRVAGEATDLVVIGARSIAPHLSGDAIAPAQIAHRLARPLGLRVLDELVAGASDPVDDAPSWRAVIASGTTER